MTLEWGKWHDARVMFLPDGSGIRIIAKGGCDAVAITFGFALGDVAAASCGPVDVDANGSPVLEGE